MTSNQITIALTKGRIEKDAVTLLEKAGFNMSFMADKGRNLIFESPDNRFRFLLVKAPDVTTCVTKYPTIATDYFNQKGEDVEIISIQGSVEIAPVIGLADAIVDIVETGSTLVANGLKVYEDICRISARMIVNKASLKNNKEVLQFILKIESLDGNEEVPYE